MLGSGRRIVMKSKDASNEPQSRQATEFDRFTEGLKKILSVRKSDLDLHQPIRPRSPKGRGDSIPKTAKS